MDRQGCNKYVLICASCIPTKKKIVYEPISKYECERCKKLYCDDHGYASSCCGENWHCIDCLRKLRPCDYCMQPMCALHDGDELCETCTYKLSRR